MIFTGPKKGNVTIINEILSYDNQSQTIGHGILNKILFYWVVHG